MAADFTASATRTHACAARSATIRAAVDTTFPSDVPLPSGRMTATATTATMTAVTMFDQPTTFRRWNRSMNTPMNGEMSV